MEIEPVFQASYHRKVKLANGELATYCVQDYAWQRFHTTNEGAPEGWVDTSELTPQEHLAIQGAIQPFVDNAISKTINLPVDFPFTSLSDVYTRAYEMGLKGCTIFRPNPVTGSVLESDKADKPSADHCCP